VQRAGELVVLDRKPTVMETRSHSQSLVLEVPRDRLERMLGSVALYAGLTVGSGQASTPLVTSFFGELIRLHDQLSPDTAERMSSIGIDLLVASIAERLSQETPRSIASTITIQRAKAYIETNLSDPTLDAPGLAIAMGVSLRRLQQLFQGHGLNISDWIWQRRLESAAIKLEDPAYLHLPIGILAYGCGFISQTHFSRRFKSRYGMTAGEYRESTTRVKSMRD
jgi:AraC-like DNA-binding protein